MRLSRILKYQRIRETIFRKAASSNRTKPPTKSRPIHDLPLPLATSESSNAMNHNSKASLRITSADYTAKNAVNRRFEGPNLRNGNPDEAVFTRFSGSRFCRRQCLTRVDCQMSLSAHLTYRP